MPLTAYTDIISLERAKKYLRIDPGMDEDNDEIVSMIKGAFRFIERYTNHIMYAREFTGHKGKIYDYPLNSVVGGTDTIDWDSYYQRNYDKIYGEYGTYIPATSISDYNAGYTELEDVPDDLIQAALQMLKVFYYESEKQVNSSLIPISVTQVLDTYRRFV